MDNKIENHGGAKAAVALVTLTRSLKGNPERFATEIDTLLNFYIKELTGAELAVMTCTLTILAANAVDEVGLQDFASRIEAASS